MKMLGSLHNVTKVVVLNEFESHIDSRIRERRSDERLIYAWFWVVLFEFFFGAT